MRKSAFSLILLTLLCSRGESVPKDGALAIPHLRQQGEAVQLIVGGKPLLMLAGELGNSSASDAASMRWIWPKLKNMHLNTALVPIYWELIEPEEGRFEFALVDSILQAARANDLKLVLLWFGTWKNSMSCYAPLWVKSDPVRFPRARTRAGEPQEILTPFSAENLQADVRAFTALMRHLRKMDEKEQTVVMVQVENEIGMIPDARDHCREADKRFAEAVPADLVAYMQKNKKTLHARLREAWEKQGSPVRGNWETLFGIGPATDEFFMAWHFARYTDEVARAGKAEYPLPMYVNAALIRPGYQPGQYPSAGPLPHLIDIWRAGAPQIDFLAPDIYFRNFREWAVQYDVPGNPLFIPEVGNDQSPANAFYAIGEHDAMGYSPFSVEDLADPGRNPLSRAYALLRQLQPLLITHQGKGSMRGVLLDSTGQHARIEMGDYLLRVRHEYSWSYARREEGVMPRYGGLFLRLADDEFIVAGTGLIIEVAPRAEGVRAGIGSVEEGRMIEGVWHSGRRLNGDQTHQGRHIQLPGQDYTMLRVKLYSYR
ncbi:MAG TPA: DUF5597 domain-containing protein [bacterium]|nr:DUF5597 domain-containing protein [bacterium]